jgi:hypothetical protein
VRTVCRIRRQVAIPCALNRRQPVLFRKTVISGERNPVNVLNSLDYNFFIQMILEGIQR